MKAETSTYKIESRIAELENRELDANGNFELALYYFELAALKEGSLANGKNRLGFSFRPDFLYGLAHLHFQRAIKQGAKVRGQYRAFKDYLGLNGELIGCDDKDEIKVGRDVYDIIDDIERAKELKELKSKNENLERKLWGDPRTHRLAGIIVGALDIASTELDGDLYDNPREKVEIDFKSQIAKRHKDAFPEYYESLSLDESWLVILSEEPALEKLFGNPLHLHKLIDSYRNRKCSKAEFKERCKRIVEGLLHTEPIDTLKGFDRFIGIAKYYSGRFKEWLMQKS